MRRLFVLIITLALLLGSCVSTSNSGSVAEPELSRADFINYVPGLPDLESGYPLEQMSGKSAFTYFKDERIRSGWNLGNTLDAYRNDGLASERAWNNPYANQELMNGVKAAGFDIIRIPVTWMGHIGPAPDHRIAQARLERVAEVAAMAHNAGLKVIINIHHDGSTSSLTKEEGWLSVSKSLKDKKQYNEITHKFVRMWAQIAAYFKDYGDWLMFESMNEIHDGGWGWSYDFRSFPNEQIDIVNEWNQLFTDIVRSTGSNNATRYLVIPAYCTKPDQTVADTFILPEDSAAGKQVVTFHYYDPSDFGITGKRAVWGSDTDKQKMDKDFEPFKVKFIDNQIPVIIGEVGAVLQLYPDDKAKEDTARKSRLEYLSYSFATAKKYGLVPVYWDNGSVAGNGEKYGLLNRTNGQPNSDDSKACIDAMIRAVR